MTDLIINIPFDGFYETLWAHEIDQEEGRECEHFEEERQEEDGIPRELWLSASEYWDVLFMNTDYQACYLAIAKIYVEAFDSLVSEAIDLKLGLRFEKMESPREYNFKTDRIFCYISQEVVAELFKRSQADEHKALEEAIKENCTSYSGFHSRYPNELEVWLEKPVETWDWNELSILLQATMSRCEDLEEWRMEVFERAASDDGFYYEWQNAVNWKKVDERVAELREEKAEEWRLEHPGDPAPQPRCPDTLETKL